MRYRLFNKVLVLPSLEREVPALEVGPFLLPGSDSKSVSTLSPVPTHYVHISSQILIFFPLNLNVSKDIL